LLLYAGLVAKLFLHRFFQLICLSLFLSFEASLSIANVDENDVSGKKNSSRKFLSQEQQAYPPSELDTGVSFSQIASKDGKHVFTVAVIEENTGSSRIERGDPLYSERRKYILARAKLAKDLMSLAHRFVINTYREHFPEIMAENPEFFDRIERDEAPEVGRDVWVIFFAGEDPTKVVATFRASRKTKAKPKLHLESGPEGKSVEVEPRYFNGDNPQPGAKTNIIGETLEIKGIASKRLNGVDLTPYLFLTAWKEFLGHTFYWRKLPKEIADTVPEPPLHVHDFFRDKIGRFKVQVTRFLLKCADRMVGYYEKLGFGVVIPDETGKNVIMESDLKTWEDHTSVLFENRKSNSVLLEDNGFVHNRIFTVWEKIFNSSSCQRLFDF